MLGHPYEKYRLVDDIKGVSAERFKNRFFTVSVTSYSFVNSFHLFFVLRFCMYQYYDSSLN